MPKTCMNLMMIILSKRSQTKKVYIVILVKQDFRKPTIVTEQRVQISGFLRLGMHRNEEGKCYKYTCRNDYGSWICLLCAYVKGHG